VNCTDPRLIKVCQECFTFLKSDLEEGRVLKRAVRKERFSTTTSVGVTFPLGMMEIRMIWKGPARSPSELGQEEGASVFIHLPFGKESDGRSALRVPAYFSVRNGPSLSILSPEGQFVSQRTGPRRVRMTPVEANLEDPVSEARRGVCHVEST